MSCREIVNHTRSGFAFMIFAAYIYQQMFGDGNTNDGEFRTRIGSQKELRDYAVLS
jgi:hypothetical protein